MNSKKQGTIKFFNKEKGFGFIRHDQSEQETFVHVSGLKQEVSEGDRVEFEIQDGRKGPVAIDVVKVD
jgi:CspA family cold shock protein